VSDSVRPVDPELGRLLLEEVQRYEPALGPDSSVSEQRRALHALKGSAGIAGERWLSESIARLERRLLAGDLQAVGEARELLAEASAALAAGRPIDAPLWPEPPAGLLASTIDPMLFGRYTAEMQDRLERIDRALAAGDDVQAALAAYREVHAMKGAALAVSDEVTAWFCHGLEERLRAAERSDALSTQALAELTRWRGVLAELFVAPERALETLRLLARPTLAPALQPLAGPPKLPANPPPVESASEVEPPRNPASEEATLRVPTAPSWCRGWPGGRACFGWS
jgi:two-component system chemotaxis sensor kinase CheA